MNETYLGNASVKRDGIVHNFTRDEVNEYRKCLKDPTYFASNYCKIIHVDKGLVPFELYPSAYDTLKTYDNPFYLIG